MIATLYPEKQPVVKDGLLFSLRWGNYFPALGGAVAAPGDRQSEAQCKSGARSAGL